MLTLVALALLLIAPVASAAEVDYLRQIKPIFKERCYACHAALKQQSGLRLDTAASIRAGGDSGAAIEPGDAASSLLMQAVTGEAGFRMPPENEGRPLEPAEIELIRQWIDSGAAAPEDEQPQQDPRQYWSYQVPSRPPLPEVADRQWVRSPIDAFIAAQHQRLGLAPAKPAEKHVLLRRVYLDLIGLPPTRDELRAFLADDRADAYERVVDDLLNRPQYGQRWGRHWMDVWRYSDWYGRRGSNEIRYSQRHIWRWRDWIVDSLNADKPYDRMIVEMLAGDEFAPGDTSVAVATGFLGRNWYKFDRNVWLFDTVERTSQALLGMTLRCCRCHDHKYDPLSHEDYYRFRAFFEPHDVRTDRVSVYTELEQDNRKTQVLKDGLALVFDKHLDRPTYRLIRGDDRSPDKDHELSPAVPAALGNTELQVEPVALPVEAFYPALRQPLADEAIEQATSKVGAAEASVLTAEKHVAAVEAELAAFAARPPAERARDAMAFLAEDFSRPNPDVWQQLSGEWVYEDGKLIERQVGSFATMVTKANHPPNFRARMKYRPLEPGTYRSIGFSFDFVDTGNSQDVYTATGDASQSVQAFHRQGGKQTYPREGIVKTSLAVGEVATAEVTARGQDLKIWLNGELKLEYVMPVKRREGKFAIWVHQGSAEFHELEIKPLTPTLEDLQHKHRAAVDQVALRRLQVVTAQAEVASIAARLAAERAKYGEAAEDERQRLAQVACRAERTVAACRVKEEVLQANQQLAAVQAAPASDKDPAAVRAARGQALATAKNKLAAAQAKLATAGQAVDSTDGTYTPLGTVYPQTSTGRRLALARWIANGRNPRTARVAVNHIWLRHFGEALVPTVANFGLHGRRPSHPELLDWLAVELIESGWSTKHMHRLMVLSSTYRMSSASAESASQSMDPENEFLWRMNSRRMEAEMVRDSVLAVTGGLDLAFGGADIPESQGESVPRRSMYFRLTPNDKMQFLELFDVADPNSCYRRIESVIPQQALAISNSQIAMRQARVLAETLDAETAAEASAGADEAFVTAAFETILTRPPSEQERDACVAFLKTHVKLLGRGKLTTFAGAAANVKLSEADRQRRARESFVHVLLNHNDFVTVR